MAAAVLRDKVTTCRPSPHLPPDLRRRRATKPAAAAAPAPL
eukprot:CAMPEP_0203818916 /NCGR_PEP_ID=MMETSP0115-20131106/33238_1 /ASSEMBLY_ACC=CAM_ASM_000227 /TAXON_ID=33651 /ORGANISM="Bicosoecid sp, Strain ms1" /LENGTH=40 /DNA_ID= /DNA_START= /DNA_END= /DNA_ORIENTATION=